MKFKNNVKKSSQLGMNCGTASNQLKKMIMFDLLKRLNLNVCYHCKLEICEVKELSVEHKVNWLDSDDPKGLFFDLNNISFSHLSCNVSKSRRKMSDHGTENRYKRHGCRCDLCREAAVESVRRYRANKS